MAGPFSGGECVAEKHKQLLNHYSEKKDLSDTEDLKRISLTA